MRNRRKRSKSPDGHGINHQQPESGSSVPVSNQLLAPTSSVPAKRIRKNGGKNAKNRSKNPFHPPFDIPAAGSKVPPHVRRAGDYLLGPRLGASPVRSISQCLARKVGTDQYYQIKMLTLVGPENSQDEKHGKMLLQTENSLLSLLEDEEGVVQKKAFFTEMCLEEQEQGRGHVYTGRICQRICLVLECLSPHDFSVDTQHMINLQHHVIKEKKMSEKEALNIFYNVVCIVKKLHDRNIVHRDLKLGNIVFHQKSRRVTINNFCLGKHLMNDKEMLKDQRGSPAYISPDVISGRPYLGKPSDMWALGVVLYTMLYGQFPFYDQVPQELFNKIKAANFKIPSEPRVSEDTKQIIIRLLKVDPAQRLTAKALKETVENVILIWRTVSPPPPFKCRLVPEFSEENTASNFKRRRQSHANPDSDTDILQNLVHLNALGGATETDAMESENQKLKQVPDHPNPYGRIPVTRVLEDARPLTAEEYRKYRDIIGKVRRNAPGLISTTGQSLLNINNDGNSSDKICSGYSAALISSRSSLLSELQRINETRHLSSRTAPIPAGPVAAPVPVLEQEAVLDLSQGRWRRPRTTSANHSSQTRGSGTGSSTSASNGSQQRSGSTSGTIRQRSGSRSLSRRHGSLVNAIQRLNPTLVNEVVMGGNSDNRNQQQSSQNRSAQNAVSMDLASVLRHLSSENSNRSNAGTSSSNRRRESNN